MHCYALSSNGVLEGNMESAVENNKIVNETIGMYGDSQATVECNIDSSIKNGVGKLLSVTGRVINISVEGSGDSARIKATLNCKVIFLNKDGVPESSDYLSDFNVAISPKESMMSNMFDMWADVNVMDMDSSVRGDVIVVQAVLDIKVYGVIRNECDGMSEVEEGILVKKAPVITERMNNIRDTFVVDEDYESGVTIDKILFFDTDVIISNSKMSDGKAIVSGDMSATVVYFAENMMTAKNFNIPFTEEIMLETMCDSDRLAIRAKVSNSKIILSGVEGNNMLSIQVEVMIEGFCVCYENREVILDMFSPRHRLDLDFCKDNFAVFRNQNTMSDKITGSAGLQESLPPATKILSTVVSRQIMANTYIDRDMIVVEGLLACSVIYLDADDEIHSVVVELPYSLQFDRGNIEEDVELVGKVMVSQLYAKIKRDREIEVTAMLNVHLSAILKQEMKCVSGYETREELVANEYGMSIYICDSGDDLWQVAKVMNAPMEELERQNGGLQKIVKNQRIVYYRQLSK